MPAENMQEFAKNEIETDSESASVGVRLLQEVLIEQPGNKIVSQDASKLNPASADASNHKTISADGIGKMIPPALEITGIGDLITNFKQESDQNQKQVFDVAKEVIHCRIPESIKELAASGNTERLKEQMDKVNDLLEAVGCQKQLRLSDKNEVEVVENGKVVTPPTLKDLIEEALKNNMLAHEIIKTGKLPDAWKDKNLELKPETMAAVNKALEIKGTKWRVDSSTAFDSESSVDGVKRQNLTLRFNGYPEDKSTVRWVPSEDTARTEQYTALSTVAEILSTGKVPEELHGKYGNRPVAMSSVDEINAALEKMGSDKRLSIENQKGAPSLTGVASYKVSIRENGKLLDAQSLLVSPLFWRKEAD